MVTMDQGVLEKIAKGILHIDTLETRKSDAWGISVEFETCSPVCLSGG